MPSDKTKYSIKRLLQMTASLILLATVTAPLSQQAMAVPTLKKKSTAAKVNPTSCNVTDDLVKDWIADDKLTDDLNSAYAALSAALPGLTDDRFGHANATNITDMRNEATSTAVRHRGELWKLAQSVVANRIPACDDCQSLNTWGKIRAVGKWTSATKLGNTVIADAKLSQMNDKDVKKETDDYLTLRSLSVDPTLAQYPDKATKAQRDRIDNDCADEINNTVAANKDLKELDKTKCTRDYLVKEVMVATADEIGKKLDAVKSPAKDKSMKDLTKSTCLPITNYEFMFHALQPL